MALVSATCCNNLPWGVSYGVEYTRPSRRDTTMLCSYCGLKENKRDPGYGRRESKSSPRTGIMTLLFLVVEIKFYDEGTEDTKDKRGSGIDPYLQG